MVSRSQNSPQRCSRRNKAGEESPGVDPVRATVSQPLSSPWEGHPGVALNCQILVNCYGKWKPQTVTKPEARPKDKNPLSGTKATITQALRLKSKPSLLCMWRAVLCGLFPRQLIGSCHHREPEMTHHLGLESHCRRSREPVSIPPLIPRQQWEHPAQSAEAAALALALISPKRHNRVSSGMSGFVF